MKRMESRHPRFKSSEIPLNTLLYGLESEVITKQNYLVFLEYCNYVTTNFSVIMLHNAGEIFPAPMSHFVIGVGSMTF